MPQPGGTTTLVHNISTQLPTAAAQLAAAVAALPACRPAPTPKHGHLHYSGGAASPAVLLIDQPRQPEGAPRLAKVAVQVPNRHQAWHRRQSERRLRRGRRAVLHMRRPGGSGALCVQRVHERVHKAGPQLQAAGRRM